MRARAPGRPVFVARYHGVGRLSHITGLRGPPNGGGHGAGEGPEWVGRHMRANTQSALKESDGHTRTSNGTGPDTMHAREYSYIGWSGTRGCTLPHSVQLLVCGVSPGTAFTKPTSYGKKNQYFHSAPMRPSLFHRSVLPRKAGRRLQSTKRNTKRSPRPPPSPSRSTTP